MNKLEIINGKPQEFTIVLANNQYEHLGSLTGIEHVKYIQNVNGADEVSFTVHKKLLTANYCENLKKYQEYIWCRLNNLMLIWIKELDEYFQIETAIDDTATGTTKNVTGKSLCESELSNINLYTTEINSESDIKRSDYYSYFPTVFYRNPDRVDDYDWDNADDPNKDSYTVYKIVNNKKVKDEVATIEKRKKILKSSSLLHRILEKVPMYTLAHVDKSLMNVQRTFSIDGTSIYDFMTGDCAEQFNCIFIFDSTKRTISAYDLYASYCMDCGKRFDDTDTCEYCGSKNLLHYGYGQDTTIYIDKTNLTDSINFTTDVGSIKNTFKLEAGDELMTATVRTLLQGGDGYVRYLPEWQKQMMPENLVAKLTDYENLYNSKTELYQGFVKDLYDKTDEKGKYEHTMFPKRDDFPDLFPDEFIDAKHELDKVINTNPPSALNGVGVAISTTLSLEHSLTSATNAVKNYIKLLVLSGFVKVEIDDSIESEIYGLHEEDGHNACTWKGKIKITNYSDPEDVASQVITAKITDDYEYFVKQKIAKDIFSSSDDDDSQNNISIYNVLSIENLSSFEKVITKYNLNSLQSFRDALDSALTVYSSTVSLENKDMKKKIYDPYYNKLKACDTEIEKRSKTIESIKKEISVLEDNIAKIQKELDMESYLGSLYPIYCTYKREDKYSNQNYISDGLESDNAALLKRANEFIELAKQELVKSCEQQHTISSTLYNLLAMKEFEPIVNYFEVGNWLRIKIDDIVYRLRLMSYTIDFDDLNTIEVEFSNATKIFNPSIQRNQIISAVTSMSKSYNTVAKQAEASKTTGTTVSEWLKDGLNSGTVKIKNNDREEVIYGKNGLLCRSYDDITDAYDPKQFRITHNIMAFTNDNWNTTKSVIGEHSYKAYDSKNNCWDKHEGYGVTTEFVTSGVVNGSQIIGGEIYSKNYKTENTRDENGEKNDGAPSGSYINLEDGSFSFAGGKLTYTPSAGLSVFTDVGTRGDLRKAYLDELFIDTEDPNGDLNCRYSFGMSSSQGFSLKYTHREAVDATELIGIGINSRNGVPFLALGQLIGNGEGEGLEVLSSVLPAVSSANDQNIGSPEQLWENIYSYNGLIQTSDKNVKKDINLISDSYENMFTSLRPVSYKFKEGDRIHVGFISQDVEKAMSDNGLTDMDFAGFCRDKEKYALRYNEFIALNTHMIQKLQSKIGALENVVNTLQVEIESLKREMNQK